MNLTGNEIIELIRKHGLEDRACSFSLPKDIYMSKPRKYKKLTEEQIAEEFKRYSSGERLVDLAKEYGTSSSYLSVENQKHLRRERLKILRNKF